VALVVGGSGVRSYEDEQGAAFGRVTGHGEHWFLGSPDQGPPQPRPAGPARSASASSSVAVTAGPSRGPAVWALGERAQLWNTRYLDAIVENLRGSGQPVCASAVRPPASTAWVGTS
jgi:hypothetical protein